MSIYEFPSFTVYCVVIAAATGAVAGSFLNCAAFRIVRHESFLKGRSRCPSCGHALGAAELIPVLSYLIQRGKCKWCGKKISVRYPLTEAAFSAITVLCLLKFDLTVLCLRNFLFLCCLFLLSLTDLQAMIIPDGCHITAVLFWAASAPFVMEGRYDVLLHVLAGFIFGGALLILSLLMDRIMGRDTLGGGDIKLFAVTGLYLGFIGTLFTLMLSCVTGLIMKVIKRPAVSLSDTEMTDAESSGAFPFGPSIAFAAAVILLYGDPLIRWYKGLL